MCVGCVVDEAASTEDDDKAGEETCRVREGGGRCS